MSTAHVSVGKYLSSSFYFFYYIFLLSNLSLLHLHHFVNVFLLLKSTVHVAVIHLGKCPGLIFLC